MSNNPAKIESQPGKVQHHTSFESPRKYVAHSPGSNFLMVSILRLYARSLQQSKSCLRLFASEVSSKRRVNLFDILQEAKHSKKMAPAMKEAIAMLEEKRLPADDAMTAINIFKLSGRPDLCLKVLDSIPAQKLGVKHFSAVVSCFGEAGMTADALNVFDRMQLSGIQPNVISYNAAITACEKGMQWEKALELFEQAERDGVKRDTCTFNAAISACEKSRQLEKALQLFDQMKRDGVKRDTITFQCCHFCL
jgi:pentatricopeptide repeat protein